MQLFPFINPAARCFTVALSSECKSTRTAAAAAGSRRWPSARVRSQCVRTGLTCRHTCRIYASDAPMSSVAAQLQFGSSRTSSGNKFKFIFIKNSMLLKNKHCDHNPTARSSHWSRKESGLTVRSSHCDSSFLFALLQQEVTSSDPLD